MILLIAIILLLVLATGSAPVWPHSQTWGPYPSSAIFVILIILVLFVLLGPIRI